MKQITINSSDLKELFIKACFHNLHIPHLRFLRWCLFKMGYKADLQNLELILDRGHINNECRYCRKSFNSAQEIKIGSTYWWPRWVGCHAECQKQGYKDEAFECQNIDQACNDCAFFKREKGSIGTCLKDNSTRITSSNFAEGNPCFVHRRYINA